MICRGICPVDRKPTNKPKAYLSSHYHVGRYAKYPLAWTGHPTPQRADGHHFTEFRCVPLLYTLCLLGCHLRLLDRFLSEVTRPRRANQKRTNPNSPREAEQCTPRQETNLLRYVPVSTETNSVAFCHRYVALSDGTRHTNQTVHCQTLALSAETHPRHT